MSQEMPPYVAILVVDIEKFSGHTDVQRQQLARMVPDVLENAFKRCGLADIWESRRFPDPTGDGYIIGFDPARLPSVVDDFFDALQAELAERAKGLRGLGMHLRLRAGLTVGPVRELDDLRVHSPVDSSMIENHRLVDTDAVRALLKNSNQDVTFVAAVLSAQVVEQTVINGRYARLHKSQLVETPVEIAAKGFRGTAYLRVPEPSGELLVRGLLGVRAKPGEEPEPEQRKAEPRHAPGTVSIGDVRGVSGVVGSFTGTGNTFGGSATGGSDR